MRGTLRAGCASPASGATRTPAPAEAMKERRFITESILISTIPGRDQHQLHQPFAFLIAAFIAIAFVSSTCSTSLASLTRYSVGSSRRRRLMLSQGQRQSSGAASEDTGRGYGETVAGVKPTIGYGL